MPFAIGITVSNLAGGWLSAKAGARVPIPGGLLLGAVGFVMLTRLGVDATYLSMLPAQTLARFGCGLAMPPMTAALLSTVPRARSGAASGAAECDPSGGGGNWGRTVRRAHAWGYDRWVAGRADDFRRPVHRRRPGRWLRAAFSRRRAACAGRRSQGPGQLNSVDHECQTAAKSGRQRLWGRWQ